MPSAKDVLGLETKHLIKAYILLISTLCVSLIVAFIIQALGVIGITHDNKHTILSAWADVAHYIGWSKGAKATESAQHWIDARPHGTATAVIVFYVVSLIGLFTMKESQTRAPATAWLSICLICIRFRDDDIIWPFIGVFVLVFAASGWRWRKGDRSNTIGAAIEGFISYPLALGYFFWHIMVGPDEVLTKSKEQSKDDDDDD